MNGLAEVTFTFLGFRNPSPWVIAIGLPFVLFALSATIDALRKPGWAFEEAERAKWFWVLAPIVGGGLCFIGSVIAAAVWWITVRAEVKAVLESVR